MLLLTGVLLPYLMSAQSCYNEVLPPRHGIAEEDATLSCGFGSDCLNSCQKCETGVLDCGLPEDEDDWVAGGRCADYNGYYPRPEKLDGIMAFSTVFAILMAFGIGANDAANAWATSVGAGAIALMPAVCIGGFFEWAGATAMGHGVSKTIQKGVAKVTEEECWACGYCNSEMSVFMGGMFGALLGASLFLLLASRLAVPVSTTHSIVGGVVGVTVAGVGGGCLNWDIDGGLGGIILSWFVSPMLAGLVAGVCYTISKRVIIKVPECRERARLFVPALYGITTYAVLMLMFFKSKSIKNEISPDPPYTWKWIIAFVSSLIVTAVVWVFFLPKVDEGLPSKTEGEAERILTAYRNHFKNWQEGTKKAVGEQLKEIEMFGDAATKDTAKAEDQTAVVISEAVSGKYDGSTGMDAETPAELDAVYCFKFLLIFNACLESFAHGSNDTANATGPFTAVYQTYTGGLYECGKTDTPVWILAVAGIFVALGIITYGRRVIKTIGTDLTLIDFHRAFWIEFGSTVAVICGTIAEMPVSTTHCQIGGVIAVGCISVGYRKVDWWLMCKIFSAWVLTLPIAGGLASVMVLASRGVLMKRMA